MGRLGISAGLLIFLAAVFGAAALDWICLDSAAAILIGKTLLRILSWLAFWR